MASHMLPPSATVAASASKGGGYRNGPERWTGQGPRPARHVPWPEIFKHHLSLIEGHTKMLDMVRKHTVPNSGDWETISAMLDRCQEIMGISKKATRDFVPPPELRDQIPVGSSSASMYPGYSPADHVYGKAAEEFGREWSVAAKTGLEFKPSTQGPHYELGQSRIAKKRRTSSTAAAEQAEGGSGNRSGSGTNDAAAATGTAATGQEHFAHHPGRPIPISSPQQSHKTTANGKPAASSKKGSANGNSSKSGEFFVIDAKPDSSTTTANGDPASHPSSEPPTKRVKRTHHDLTNGGVSAAATVPADDISHEVDERLRAKQERRRARAEKKATETEKETEKEKSKDKKQKRKRVRSGSDESNGGGEVGDGPAKVEQVDAAEASEKPKKKKSKTVNVTVAETEGAIAAEDGAAAGVSKRRKGSGSGSDGHPTKKRHKTTRA